MASPIRSTSGKKRSSDNELDQSNTRQRVLDVAPLNIVPHGGAPVLPRDHTSTSAEIENVLAATTTGVELTGTPTMRKAGPAVGLFDIGESVDSYIFRVSLLGVPKDHDEFTCQIEPSGKVTIEGVTSTGEARVRRFTHNFEMLSRNLCPPGRFSVTFSLPGPVDHRQFSGLSGTAGVLEGIVKKRS